MKGKTEPVLIYGLRGDAEEKATEAFQALEKKHDAMIAGYRSQQWDIASTLIVECRALAQQTNGEKHGLGGLDVLYDLYDERIAAYKAEPPGADWDGVFFATSK